VPRELVLGSDISLMETCNMSFCGLVGQVSYHYLSQEPIQAWMDKNWQPILGYSPRVFFLEKGWLGFQCRSSEDAEILLETRWVFGASSLMIKRWHVSLNPHSEYFSKRHLWVLLPGLPLHFWNESTLRSIGDSLGTFISVDNATLRAPDRKVNKVLVELDIHGGLHESLDIVWRERKKKQHLDYLGIPFRCNRCHSTGHLRRDCKGGEVMEDIDEELDNWDIPDCTPDVELFGKFDPNYRSVTRNQGSFNGETIGKLKYFCPSLFNSLTLWENDFLDSAPILDSFSEAEAVSRDGTLTLGR
jgi:hypothetical protein